MKPLEELTKAEKMKVLEFELRRRKMKPFEEMTKAEKMKVLEEDYLERQEKEKERLQKKERRQEMWLNIGKATVITLLILIMFASFVALVVGAVLEKDAGQRTKDIVGAVFFGLVSALFVFGLSYCIIKD